MLNLKTNLRNVLIETAELLRNNYNFIYYDTRSAEDLKIMRNFCKSKVNCIGFAGGGQNAFMDFWWFSVHSYCWTCAFQGPLGAQGAVGCPLATTHVNHFLRGLFGVICLGVDLLDVDLC